ncbi:MAG: 3-dehydroquinate synthase [Anaeromyxobacter sp.]|nr:3-dehydroquinate synthase [Anaeromyxobacter sp.]
MPQPTEILQARQGDQRYEVRVGPAALAALPALAARHDRLAVVSCARVASTPAGKRALAAARRAGPVALVHLLPDGEQGKTLAQLERAASRLLAAGLTRRSLVISIGGGAVSDAAGFLAATFMRGVAWVAVPTTLLAMVDAALGGKTAVNLPLAKNAVGAFHPPAAVLADPRALATLPARELTSGLGEVVKYALLEPALLGRLAEARGGRGGRRGAGGPGLPGADLVAACMLAKLRVVEADPTEQGARKLLNLGHTFGHGVEAAGRFERYTHGEAVAVGLCFAFQLAAQLERIGPLALAEAEAAVAAAGLPTRVPAAVARRAAALMVHDKKRTASGLRWVLPRQAGGSAWVVEWDVAAGDQAVQAAVRAISGR